MKHMNPVDLKLYLVTDSGYYDEKRFLDRKSTRLNSSH